jgi:hypothetical protein
MEQRQLWLLKQLKMTSLKISNKMESIERQLIDKWKELYTEAIRQFKPYSTRRLVKIKDDIKKLELKLQEEKTEV